MPAASPVQIIELERTAGERGYAFVGLAGPIGESEFTLAWSDPEIGDGIYDVRAHWDGFGAVKFEFEIAKNLPDLTPMSSSPVHAWAHWLTNGHLLVAWASIDEQESHGWAIVANSIGPEVDFENPTADWLARLLVQSITAIFRQSQPLSDQPGGVYS